MIEKPRRIAARHGNQQGGVVLWVVIAVVTLTIIIGAVVWLLQSQAAQQKMSHRKADEICDYGMAAAFDSISTNPAWSGPIPQTPLDNGTYQVTLTQTTQADSVIQTIVSEGVFGSQTQKKKCVLARAVSDSTGTWIRREME